MKTVNDYFSLAKEIHDDNVKAGWWSKPRSKECFYELFHSELSEGFEGLRKGLNDTHLTQYPMFQVELADFVIRVMDYLGSKNDDCFHPEILSFPIKEADVVFINLSDEFCLLTQIRYLLSTCVGSSFDTYNLIQSVRLCELYAQDDGWDIWVMIEEKRVYNRHRVDHKLENRMKHGGKKF